MAYSQIFLSGIYQKPHLCTFSKDMNEGRTDVYNVAK